MSVDRSFSGRTNPFGSVVIRDSSGRHLTHAVPDKSIKSMVLDMAKLNETNVWLGEAELVSPCVDCYQGLIEWMNKGCYATMLPVDGRDKGHMDWMSEMIKHLMHGLLATKGTRRVGLVWKCCDGEDSDTLGRSVLSMNDATIPDTTSNRIRSNSARMRPRVVVQLENENDVDVALRAVVDMDRGRIRDDCVISVVLIDEEECIFSMLNVVVARNRLSFLNLASLVEEIGTLHQAGKAGDFRLQCGQLTELNKLAAMYLDGNTKIYVVAYPQQEDFSFVDAIASVCAGDQTVRTDIQWIDPRDVPEYRPLSIQSSGKFSNLKNIPSLSKDYDIFHSPSIETMRQDLRVQTTEHLSAAAKRAMDRIFDHESPTDPKPERKGLFPERRMLHFPSLRSSVSKEHAQQEEWIPVDRSRDVFSSLRTTGEKYYNSTEQMENDDVIESISLQRPTTSTDEHCIPEFEEHDNDNDNDDDHISERVSAHSEINVKEEIYKNIETKVNGKLLDSIRELQEQLEWSEMQRHQLEAKVEVLSDGLDAGWRQSDHESLIKSLAEERKSVKKMEGLLLSMKQEKLAQEVELASKEKELCLARARVQALQSHSDVGIAFELCEHEVEMAQEEARHLRAENQEMARRVAMMDMANILQSHSPILPENEEYDVNGAEGRIIYKLHEKIKALQGKLSRTEQENADMARALERAKRDERRTIVTKKVAQDALAKLSHATKKDHIRCH